MRRRKDHQIVTASIACAIAALLAAPVASAQAPSDEAELRATIAAQMAQGPAAAGAHVVDLGDGHVVFDDRGGEQRLSASVTKLYTTATALLRLGPRARVPTRVLATGRRDGATWDGDLYLRGGGDFTFGTAEFARRAYGSSASVERLAARLRRAGLRRVRGSVLGDATLFSDNGGSPFELVLCPDPLFGRGCPYGPAGHLERPIPNGPRTPIGFDRGLRDATGVEPQRRPAVFAARRLTRALREAGISVDGAAGAAPDARPGAHARDDAVTHGRAARPADQPAVGQLRGRLDAAAASAPGSPGTAPARAARAWSRARSRAGSGSRPPSGPARARRSRTARRRASWCSC